jgi:hypothetical protein
LTTNANSPPLTDPTFRLDYYLAKPGGTYGAPKASKWVIAEASWAPIGFVISGAAIDNNEGDNLKVQTMVLDGVVNMLGANYTLAPNGNTPNGNAWMLDWSGSAAVLGQALAANYNFYFFGHGGPWSFGAYNGSTIGAWALGSLSNFPSSRVPTNSHPFKLVFIDGCQAGKCSLCESFGIPTQSVDTNYFILAGVRARAFLGFTKDVAFNTEQYDDRATMLAQFWADWLNHQTLYYCVTNAQKKWTTQPMPMSAIIHGATNLMITTY